LQDCPGSLARPPVCTRWPPPRLPDLPVAVASNPSVRKARELGTLRPTLDRLFAFSPWSPISCPIRHEPTTTFRSRVVVRSCDRPNPHAVLHPLSRDAVFQVIPEGRHPSTLTSDSTPNVYSRQGTVNHQTGGCPWLPNLGPLPPTHCHYSLSRITARRRCVRHLS